MKSMKEKSVRQKILESSLYNSGESFTIHQMKQHLRGGVTNAQVKASLIHMRHQHEVMWAFARWHKPVTHWVNKRRLNDSDWLISIMEMEKSRASRQASE